jgi:hypothetical protein
MSQSKSSSSSSLSSSSAPSKKVLQADENFIKHLYAGHPPEDYKVVPSCSFRYVDNNLNNNGSTNNNNSSSNSNSNSSSSNNNTKKGGSRKKQNEIITRRIAKFYNLFDPMLNFLLMSRYALHNKQRGVHVETLPIDYIMVIHLVDVPTDSDDSDEHGGDERGEGGGKKNKAIRPYLRVDKFEIRSVTELNEEEKKALEDDLRDKEYGEFQLPHLVSYRTRPDKNNNDGGDDDDNDKSTGGGYYIWTSLRTHCYDFNPLIIGRIRQKALMERIIAFAQAINEIALGGRQDLYDMIKKQMKESRRVQCSVPLPTLLQERSDAVNAVVDAAGGIDGGVFASASAAVVPSSCQQVMKEEDDDKENDVAKNSKVVISGDKAGKEGKYKKKEKDENEDCAIMKAIINVNAQ